MIVPSQPIRPVVALGRKELAVPDGTALCVDLCPMSFVSITGTTGPRYSVNVHARLREEPTSELLSSLAGTVVLHEERGTITTRIPTGMGIGDCEFYVDVEGPSANAVVVRSPWAAVDIADVAGSIDIESAHGRISLDGCSGDTIVKGHTGAHVVWSRGSGRVDLEADGIEALVGNTAQPSQFRARSANGTRLFVPRGADLTYEISVVSSELFKCDPLLRKEFKRLDDRSAWTRVSTKGASTVSVSSICGPVEIRTYEP